MTGFRLYIVVHVSFTWCLIQSYKRVILRVKKY